MPLDWLGLILSGNHLSVRRFTTPFGPRPVIYPALEPNFVQAKAQTRSGHTRPASRDYRTACINSRKQALQLGGAEKFAIIRNQRRERHT